MIRQILAVLGERLRGHRAGERELEEAVDPVLLVDLERVDRLDLARLAEHLRGVADRAVLDEHAPDLLVERRQEVRHRLRQLRGDRVERVLRVPRLALRLARVLLELLDHVERVPRVLRVVDEAPAREAERALALLADRAAILAGREAERRHLELVTGGDALRAQPDDGAPGQHGMRVGACDHRVHRVVLAELAVGRDDAAGVKRGLIVHDASVFSTTRAA